MNSGQIKEMFNTMSYTDDYTNIVEQVDKNQLNQKWWKALTAIKDLHPKTKVADVLAAASTDKKIERESEKVKRAITNQIFKKNPESAITQIIKLNKDCQAFVSKAKGHTTSEAFINSLSEQAGVNLDKETVDEKIKNIGELFASAVKLYILLGE